MTLAARPSYRLGLLTLGCVLAVGMTSTARAGMVQVLPNVFTRGVTVTYKVASYGVGNLNITGMDYTWQTDPNASAATVFGKCTAGTFALNAYFDLDTGKLMGNYAGTSLSVTGERTAGNLETLYKATRIIAFDCVLSPVSTQSTFDFMWQKDADGGIFANGSSLPFIGTIAQTGAPLMNADKSAGAFATQQTLTNGVACWADSTAVGTVLFQSNSAIGSANTFMTPTPQSLGGGLVLLAASALKRRRRTTASSVAA